MTRTVAIAALLAGAALSAAPAAHADPLPDPLVPQMCHYWTDYPFCTPEVPNPLHDAIQPKCFYWTDYPFCVPPQ